MTNKDRFIDWLYAATIILGSGASILTSVGVFNAAAVATPETAPDDLYIAMAVANIILTIAVAIFSWKMHFRK